MLDTGSSVTLVPQRLLPRGTRLERYDGPLLHDVSGRPLTVHGLLPVTITIRELRRSFKWTVLVAKITHAIIGSDFLHNYHLAVSCSSSSLYDETTKMRCAVGAIATAQPSIRLSDTSSLPPSVDAMLREFPALTAPQCGTSSDDNVEVVFRIETTGTPVSQRPRRLAPDKQRYAQQHFEELLASGIIERSESEWASPLHMAPKGSGEWRPCGDYRLLNRRTRKDQYPLPVIKDVFTQLAGSRIFSKLDLKRAYHHIPVAEEDRHKTAVTTPFGLFQYRRMPFGLKNSAQAFQRYIDSIIQPLSQDCRPFVACYLDDILVFSPDADIHAIHLRTLLEHLNKHHLHLNVTKCTFFRTEIDFLGHHISAEGVRPSPAKIQALKDMPSPQSYDQLRSRLGAINFYRSFLPNAAGVLEPIQTLLNSNQPRQTTRSGGNHERSMPWTTEHEDSYRKALRLLADAVLSHPPKDIAFVTLTTDASDRAIGAVLHANDERLPLGFFSRRLSPTECTRSAFDRELLALSSAAKHFAVYTETTHTIAQTDHRPLVSAIDSRSTTAHNRSRWQLARLATVAELVDEVRYIPGKENLVADALSRVSAVTVDVHDLPAIAESQKADCSLQSVITEYNLSATTLDNGATLYSRADGPHPRPYVPAALRPLLIKQIHNLAHPGVRGTQTLVLSSFWWPKAKADVREFVRLCQTCQQSKITRHTHAESAPMPVPSKRFSMVHIDIVGPLPTVHLRFRYLLTAVDRTTSWCVAEPLTDISADTVARAFLRCWVCQFGVPLHVITDQGRQFESTLFTRLAKLLGFSRLRTTAYRPQSNGKVERFHRRLKDALRARGDNWYDDLPIVLWTFRHTTPRGALFPPYTMVTGEPSSFPSHVAESSAEGPETVLKRLHNVVETATANATELPAVPAPEPDSLRNAARAWVRVDRVRRPLEAPYTGPFDIVARHARFYTLRTPRGLENVSIHRLKPVREPLKRVRFQLP